MISLDSFSFESRYLFNYFLSSGTMSLSIIKIIYDTKHPNLNPPTKDILHKWCDLSPDTEKRRNNKKWWWTIILGEAYSLFKPIDFRPKLYHKIHSTTSFLQPILFRFYRRLRHIGVSAISIFNVLTLSSQKFPSLFGFPLFFSKKNKIKRL